MAIAGACVHVEKKETDISGAEIPRTDKWISLTFDDGPSGNTELLLNVLAENDIKATFFLTCRKLESEENKARARKILDEGHEIANHGYEHKKLGEGLSIDEIRDNIGKGQAAIKAVSGSEPVLFRAPNFNRNDDVTSVLREMGLVYIGGISPRDSRKETTTEQIIEKVLELARDGGVVVLHDSGHGNINTMPAIPVIAGELRKRGYGFLTVGEMIKRKNVSLEPGKWYDFFSE